MTRILLLGSGGQVGWELRRCLASLGTVTALDYPELDFEDGKALRSAVTAARPEIIVNAAAYTDVDGAESSRDVAMRINAEAPGILAAEARRLEAKLVHYSTDYIFDGTGTTPYRESDTPAPLGEYGRTKLEGERAIVAEGRESRLHVILRTSCVYGTRRDSFVTRVLARAHRGPELRVVTDQVGSPTWCRALAETTAQMLAGAAVGGHEWWERRSGIYHLAGDGHSSRFDWARAILRHDPRARKHAVREVRPARSSEFPTAASRPAFSALDCGLFRTTFGLRLPPWEDALKMALEA